MFMKPQPDNCHCGEPPFTCLGVCCFPCPIQSNHILPICDAMSKNIDNTADRPFFPIHSPNVPPFFFSSFDFSSPPPPPRPQKKNSSIPICFAKLLHIVPLHRNKLTLVIFFLLFYTMIKLRYFKLFINCNTRMYPFHCLFSATFILIGRYTSYCTYRICT